MLVQDSLRHSRVAESTRHRSGSATYGSARPLKVVNSTQLLRLFSRNSCEPVRRLRHSSVPAILYAPVRTAGLKRLSL